MLASLAVLVSLAVAATADLSHGHGHAAHHPRMHMQQKKEVSYVPRSTQYTLVDHFEGNGFFDGWDFFSWDDPTHGLVNYQTREDAFAKNLTYVQADNTTVITVDNKSKLAPGAKRDSVRISTHKKYERGLFIADFWSMPHGCSVWPAYWSLGTGRDWPNGGEIDIIEGVNEMTTNQVTVHTGPGCLLDQGAKATARMMGTVCESRDGNNAGCSWDIGKPQSYGHGFNMQAGGVYAHTLEANGVSVWFFERGQVPADITARTPDPSAWGTPTAFFPHTQCDILEHFTPQELILDITLCGDWATDAFGQSGCKGACADLIADPENYKLAAWKIHYISVYQ